ncbi:hypothetical protein D049_1031B, partial [Vibrio parahaemolyticus VPTS-2010]
YYHFALVLNRLNYIHIKCLSTIVTKT